MTLLDDADAAAKRLAAGKMTEDDRTMVSYYLATRAASERAASRLVEWARMRARQ